MVYRLIKWSGGVALFRRIAQLVERRSPKPQVVSSRLTAPVAVPAVAAALLNIEVRMVRNTGMMCRVGII